MNQQLLTKLMPRLKRLDRGGYRRAYRRGACLEGTSTQQLIAELLSSFRVPFKRNPPVPGTRGLRADFVVNGTLVFVDRDLDEVQLRALVKGKRRAVVVKRDSVRSDRLDHGIRVLSLGEDPRLQTIFLDDPSFNFDYAHILPGTQKCSVMHGHTSSALVEIVGHPVEGMVVDFGAAKEVVRDAIRSLDHKLFINEKYVTSMSDRNVSLKFRTVHGDFLISAPRATTVMMKGEATVENLAQEVLARVSKKMPENVTAVGVYVYEGLNKGSHVLAQIHQESAKTRKKR